MTSGECPWRRRETARVPCERGRCGVPPLKCLGGVVSSRVVCPVVGLPQSPSVVAYLSRKKIKLR